MTINVQADRGVPAAGGNDVFAFGPCFIPTHIRYRALIHRFMQPPHRGWLSTQQISAKKTLLSVGQYRPLNTLVKNGNFMEESILTAVFLPLALAFIMLGMGLTLTPADFRRIPDCT